LKTINTYKVEQGLFRDVAKLIDETRKSVAYTVNSALTYMYWQIGKRINDEILQHERAEYGSQIVVSLGQQLQITYGEGFDKSNLTRMMNFAVMFPNEAIVVSLTQQLSWSHILALLPLKDPLQQEFYVEMCKMERWSVRTLRQKIEQGKSRRDGTLLTVGFNLRRKDAARHVSTQSRRDDIINAKYRPCRTLDAHSVSSFRRLHLRLIKCRHCVTLTSSSIKNQKSSIKNVNGNQISI
jgi:hypothetical protein